MAWSKVQDSAQSMGAGTSGTFPYPANVTGGNLLLALAVFNGTAAQTWTISDTLGNTWAPLLSQFASVDSGLTLMAWAAYSPSGGANTVSLGWTNSNVNGGDLVLLEWSGISGSLVQDGTAQTYEATAEHTTTSPSYTPTVTGDLVISLDASGFGIGSFGAPWTAGDVNMGHSGGAWAWTTGATSAIANSATDVSGGTPGHSAVIFGIRSAGSSGLSLIASAGTASAAGGAAAAGQPGTRFTLAIGP